MSIKIKNVLLDNKKTDILIENNKISEIAQKISTEAETKIDGNKKAIIPGLINGHTHAAMTLFRGYAEDMKLDDWLQKKIWPLEAKITENDVYWGTRLAALEMIKSGTTFFNDMYWHFNGTAKAVEDSGIRAKLSGVFIDLFDKDKAIEQKKEVNKLYQESKKYSEKITFALGPHAIYTVSTETLQWIKEFSDKNNVMIHFHLSETKKEVDDCIKQFGKRPVEYLKDIGFLSKNLVCAHAVWLNQKEIDLLKINDVSVVHNPASNKKLTVGKTFNYEKIKNSGIRMALGTDGTASNNNLDMFEEMKIAGLLQKYTTNDPTIMPAQDIFNMATKWGANALNLNSGEIKEGMLADVLLIDLNTPNLVPNHNLISNLVYSANGSCVDTTIVDGKILMQNRLVNDENKVLEKAQEVAMDFVSR